MRAERGFTLIELLVVVIIIGITLRFAFLALGDFGVSRRALVNAEQLLTYIKLVQQRALLEGAALGIDVQAGGYTTLRYERGAWLPLSGKGIFRPRVFPRNIVVNAQPKASIKKPAIRIDASGDLSNPFTIHLGTAEKPALATLDGRADGQLVLHE